MRSLHLRLPIVGTKAIFNTTPKIRPTLFQHNRYPILVSMMADDGANKEQILIDEQTKKKEEEEKKPVVLPEPPEKPLPGDCCGSGCVRCVWDVYYEELEDYNNLLKEQGVKS